MTLMLIKYQFLKKTIWYKKNLIDHDLEKSLSDEGDHDSNDETEFDNDESNE